MAFRVEGGAGGLHIPARLGELLYGHGTALSIAALQPCPGSQELPAQQHIHLREALAIQQDIPHTGAHGSHEIHLPFIGALGVGIWAHLDYGVVVQHLHLENVLGDPSGPEVGQRRRWLQVIQGQRPYCEVNGARAYLRVHERPAVGGKFHQPAFGNHLHRGRREDRKSDGSGQRDLQCWRMKVGIASVGGA